MHRQNVFKLYLSHKKQGIKINAKYNSWREILFGTLNKGQFQELCCSIFDERISGLYQKAANKLRALPRITSYISLPKKKLLLNSFFNAQFNCCPLVWIMHSRSNNNMIKHLNQRCLRIVYQDKQSSYENLLLKDGTVSMHYRNIQALAIEITK